MFIDKLDDTIKIGSLKFSIEQLTLWIAGFGGKVLRTIVIVVLMTAILKLGNKAIDKWIKSKGNKGKATADRLGIESFGFNEGMAKTIGAILKSLLRYAVYFLGITAILSIFFGTISLTLASIGGVAIGFGAQDLVKDVIAGIFILIENQYMVGEYIGIEDKSGIVESIEIRVTRIRDFNGDLHIIPNGSITNVTNHSRGSRRVSVDVVISYDANLNKAIDIINNISLEYGKENEDIVEAPKVAGITELGARGISIRIIGRAKPMKEWGCELELRKKIKLALDKAEIDIPHNVMDILTENNI